MASQKEVATPRWLVVVIQVHQVLAGLDALADSLAGQGQGQGQGQGLGVAMVIQVAHRVVLADDERVAARGTIIERDGIDVPAPAPRFSRTPSSLSHPPHALGAGTRAVLSEWGVAGVADLLADGAVVQAVG